MRDQTDPDVPPPDGSPLVDFGPVPRRLQTVGGVLAALSLLGCVVDGVLNGLTFALMGRWVGIFVVTMVGAAAVTTALHALGGADRAGRRGERLSSVDVGIAPRRFQVTPEDDEDTAG